MKINKTKDGNSLTIAVEGRLDTLAAPKFEEEVMKSIGDITDLTFDLEKLEYVSSSGLRVFLKAQKTMEGQQGTMVLQNVGDSIHQILDVTGFTNILNIE